MNLKIKALMTSLLLFSFATMAGDFKVEKNIVFKAVGEKEIKLDLYTPTTNAEAKFPLLVWVHGGAWKRGSKDAIPEKNPLLLQSVLKAGYALASVDYRLSGEVDFPAPVQDINDALNYLNEHADRLNINADELVMMGRSAGGHLAGFIGATNSAYSKVNFYEPPKYQVLGVVSFFGPTDLLALGSKSGKKTSKKSSVSRFLGDIPSHIPEVARQASTTTYINENTPPYIQLHGTVDKRVPLSQSEILKARLDEYGIANQLFIEEGVGHSAPVFDTEKYVPHVMDFLTKYLPVQHH
ncbi:alpha/beta hydrolase [uncultured Endozoicomonas sp.]|uniref:alpha/beta hydrolase n=1 Tax=uncultured Endozoicomonas sp. TaxID=432652 RepID=UPI002613DF40|nr:alpha/beta hydrolase [uncultured Endozoicomonas sp.]